MKTKELIALLQAADPSGEAPVRIDGGYPSFVQMLPAYYDGVAMFETTDGLTITDKGNKVVIHTKGIYDFVESEQGSLKRICLDMDEGERKEKYVQKLREAQEDYDDLNNFKDIM